MNEQIFRIRPYSKRELAGLYFPFTKNADTAVKNLNSGTESKKEQQPDAPQSGLAGRTGGSPLHHIIVEC